MASLAPPTNDGALPTMVRGSYLHVSSHSGVSEMWGRQKLLPNPPTYSYPTQPSPPHPTPGEPQGQEVLSLRAVPLN